MGTERTLPMRILPLVGLLSLTGFASAQTTWLVPDQIPTIQEAVDLASSGDHVLVSPGVYRENVQIVEKSLRVQGLAGAAATIIDGNGEGRCLMLKPTLDGSSTMVVDGFTLTGGVANQGGGVYISDSGAEVRNCVITGNHATDTGGGVFTFFNFGSLTNTIIHGNSAVSGGGGIHNFGFSMARIVNCTVVNNQVTQPSSTSAGVKVDNYGVTMINTVVRGNLAGNNVSSVTYSPYFRPVHCNFEGSGQFAGHGNLDVDPLFVDPANGDFHLRPGSPNVDAGSKLPPWLEVDISRDIDGDQRVGNPIDIGADELRARVYLSGVIEAGNTVQLTAIGYDPGTSLSAWLSTELLEGPTSTPFGDWWLADRRVTLLDQQTLPGGGLFQMPYAIPPTVPLGTPLHLQALTDATLTKPTSSVVH